MSKQTANANVVDYAMAGKDAHGYGNMNTISTNGGYFYTGHLPRRLAEIVGKRRASIRQVIYSYGTPIAWLDAGAWVVPYVRYSVTTGRHQGYLWKLPARIDIAPDESLDGYMAFLNGTKRPYGWDLLRKTYR